MGAGVRWMVGSLATLMAAVAAAPALAAPSPLRRDLPAGAVSAPAAGLFAVTERLAPLDGPVQQASTLSENRCHFSGTCARHMRLRALRIADEYRFGNHDGPVIV
jgi:hypothetical protein